MKKVLLLFFVMVFCISSFANSASPIKYKNIKLKQKIYYNQEQNKWYNSDKNSDHYFEKTVNADGLTVYVDQNKNYAFTTDCDYEFINNDKFVCYSNTDLKFYELTKNDEVITKALLSEEETATLLPNFTIIKISQFNKTTNSYKIKKKDIKSKIFILNDTPAKFEDYTFSSNNANVQNYLLNGFVKITSSGMIQFAPKQDDINKPWYVLLIR